MNNPLVPHFRAIVAPGSAHKVARGVFADLDFFGTGEVKRYVIVNHGDPLDAAGCEVEFGDPGMFEWVASEQIAPADLELTMVQVSFPGWRDVENAKWKVLQGLARLVGSQYADLDRAAYDMVAYLEKAGFDLVPKERS